MDVARYLIHLLGQDPEPDFMSPLRLQKLMYYVQGWSLAHRKTPMFSEPIEAWQHGPVVPAVWQYFRQYEGQPIPPGEAQGIERRLATNDRSFIDSVWAHYKQFSPSELRRKTHQESPWCEARVGAETSDAAREISHAAMLQFFSGELDRTVIPGLEPDAVTEAERDFASGRGVRLKDLLSGSRHGR